METTRVQIKYVFIDISEKIFVKVKGTPVSFSTFPTKGGNFCVFILFKSICNLGGKDENTKIAACIKGSSLKGKNLLLGSKFFPLKLTLIEKGGKIENDRVASPESVAINLNRCHNYKHP